MKAQALLLLLATSSGLAQGTVEVLDFDNAYYEHYSGSSTTPPAVKEAGFRFFAQGNARYGVIQIVPHLPPGYPPQDTFLQVSLPHIWALALQRPAGYPFNLLSLKIGQYNWLHPTTFNMQMKGHFQNGGTVSTNFVIPGDQIFHLFTLSSDWENVIYVEFDADWAYSIDTVRVSTPHLPVVNCATNSIVECGTLTDITMWVSDPDEDSLTVLWILNGTAATTNLLPGSTATVGTNVSLSAMLPLGSNVLNVTVADSVSSVSCSTIISVVDTTPPVIHSVTATPDVLWPPNRQMISVRVEAEVTDTCGPATWKIIRISSNEPEDGKNRGRTSPDWQITRDDTVLLRAERSGEGSGRVYTITILATDPSGNTSQASVTVTVPHDAAKKSATFGSRRGAAVDGS